MTIYVLLSCLGCDAMHSGGGRDPGSVDVLTSTHVDSISLNVSISLLHRQNHTHHVHSHCFCNTLLVYVIQPITTQRADSLSTAPHPTPPSVHSVTQSAKRVDISKTIQDRHSYSARLSRQEAQLSLRNSASATTTLEVTKLQLDNRLR